MLHLRRSPQPLFRVLPALVLTLLVSGCSAARGPARADTVPSLVAFQTQIVNALAGAADIQPGVRISDRTTVEHKKIARDYLAHLLSAIGLEPRRQAYSAEGENVYGILS